MSWRKMEDLVVALLPCQARQLDCDGDSRSSQGWRWLMLYRRLQQIYMWQYLTTELHGVAQHSATELGILTKFVIRDISHVYHRIPLLHCMRCGDDLIYYQHRIGYYAKEKGLKMKIIPLLDSVDTFLQVVFIKYRSSS
jgi:hypothetical protein